MGSGLVVHQGSDEDSGCADDEAGCDGKVEEGDGGKEGKQNAEGGGEAFENIVRVFDDNGSDETANDLNRNCRPCPCTKVAEDVLEEWLGGVCAVEDREESGDEGEEGQLDVANPEVGLGVLEDHLKIDTGETGGEAGCGDCAEALERAHDMDVKRRRVGGAADGNIRGAGVSDGGRLYLDDADSDGEEEKGEPFGGRELSAEEGNGEGCGRQNLHLVGDLEGGDGQVTDGDELQRVLDDIEDGGDG